MTHSALSEVSPATNIYRLVSTVSNKSSIGHLAAAPVMITYVLKQHAVFDCSSNKLWILDLYFLTVFYC